MNLILVLVWGLKCGKKRPVKDRRPKRPKSAATTPVHVEAGRSTKSVMGNENKTKNIFLWGAFDILHEGHFRLFQEASKLGNLYVIVLPDKRMGESKRIILNENERKENLLKTGYVKDVFIDALPDLKCFDLVSPDIFCFGYDQDAQWQEKLRSYINNKFPQCKFVIMGKYADIHSSNLRGAMKYSCGSRKNTKVSCKIK